ncbi:MAG: GMC family oxidoreductase [Chloroflexaceae bacterium]|nr:GMC family oxidoreductase [Chloroflexaceae bacterium]
MTTERYDIIIIGTARAAARWPMHSRRPEKKILLLERGDYLPRERENWSTEAVFKQKRYQAHETWYYNGTPFRPEINYWVGGNTKLFGAAMFRLREADFGEIRHAGGISPAWPVEYDVFAPYYTQAEQLYHVHGERGIDPTEPPADAPYPHPPLRHEPRIIQLKDDLEKLGYRPFPLPMGIRLSEQRGDSPVYHSTFDGYPDLTESKADAHVICVKPALTHTNVTLLCNRLVWKLVTDASGRTVTEVHARHNGETEVYRTDLVIVAAGAANSAAIFLRSANDQHPHGLANRSGLLGRNYICHNNATFVAISKQPNASIFQKTLAMSDWYGPSADWEYPMGLIQMLGKVDETLMAFESPQPLGDMSYAEMAAYSLDFWLQSEDLPDPENRITINQAGEIELQYNANNLEAYERLTAKLRSLLGSIGCHDRMIPVDYYLGTRFPFNLAHQAGTMRFGTDPATSVLDVNCKPHDLDNVYVTDAAFMPSIGAVNPSLTIIANTLRVADHLKAEVR